MHASRPAHDGMDRKGTMKRPELAGWPVDDATTGMTVFAACYWTPRVWSVEAMREGQAVVCGCCTLDHGPWRNSDLRDALVTEQAWETARKRHSGHGS